MKKRISLIIAAVLVLTSFTVFADTKAKKIDGWFYGIKVIINGQTLNSPLEPFIYNDNTYVPLRAIVEGMGGTPTWDDSTKTITINSDEITKLKNEITSLNFELSNTKSQLKTKEDKVKDLEEEIDNLKDDDDDDDEDLEDLEDDLKDDYDTYNDGTVKMKFSYSADKSSSVVELEMKGNFSRSDDTWQDRSEDDFQDFIESICEAVHDDNNFDDYDIEVTVKDEDNKTIGEYEYDEGKDKFTVGDEY